MSVGLYRYVIIYTTQTTASKKDFVEIIEKHLKGDEVCFVGDEAHGLGANVTKRALLPIYRYRIGLSATPQRWFDDVGTSILNSYFGDDPFSFTILQAQTTINPLQKILITHKCSICGHGLSCFLQAFFGESCKMFLEKIASPFWRKLQRPVQSLREPQPATADIW